jgi:hypothetical protein
MDALNAVQERQHAALQRAWQKQQIVNDLDRYRSLVKQLQPQLDAIGPVLRQLGAIQELAAQLPRDLTGTASCICRDQIQATTMAAVTSLGHRRERLARQVEPALAKIPILEQQLATFS